VGRVVQRVELRMVRAMAQVTMVMVETTTPEDVADQMQLEPDSV